MSENGDPEVDISGLKSEAHAEVMRHPPDQPRPPAPAALTAQATMTDHSASTPSAERGRPLADARAVLTSPVNPAAARSEFPALSLQPEFTPRADGCYDLNDLLKFHDRHFVNNVHLALLGRPPSDSELTRHLDDLLSGRTGKVQIIESLLLSPEGEGRQAQVRGLRSPALRWLSRAPLLGYLFRLAKGLLRLPVLMRNQQQFEAFTMSRQQLIVDHINRVVEEHALGGDSPLAANMSELVVMLTDALAELSADVGAIEAQLSAVAEALAKQQQQLGEVKEEQRAAQAAQQELIIQEQAVIVETQRAALAQIQNQLDALRQKQEEMAAALSR